MSYYIIDGMPVFLTWARYYQLKEEITERFNIGDDCFYGIRGWNSREASLLSAAIRELLLEKKQTNPEQFYTGWVSFYMERDEASDNVWDLIYDYSHLTGNSVIRDARFNKTCPYDPYCAADKTKFALDITAGKRQFPGRLFDSPKTGTLWIDSNQVKKISGTLNDFVVIHDDQQIRFAAMIEIHDY